MTENIFIFAHEFSIFKIWCYNKYLCDTIWNFVHLWYISMIYLLPKYTNHKEPVLIKELYTYIYIHNIKNIPFPYIYHASFSVSKLVELFVARCAYWESWFVICNFVSNCNLQFDIVKSAHIVRYYQYATFSNKGQITRQFCSITSRSAFIFIFKFWPCFCATKNISLIVHFQQKVHSGRM